MERDCDIRIENRRFKYRAAAIIIENGCVLLAGNEKNDYLYSVGGAVHIGESAEEAVVREVFEETGIKYSVDRLAFIHENFFIEEGVRWHEVAFYFLMSPRGTQKLNSSSYTMGVKENMHWILINDLSYIKAFPTFFKDKLLNLPNKIEHIISVEE